MRTFLIFSAAGLLAALGISILAMTNDAPVERSNAAPAVCSTNARAAALAPGIYSASPCSMLVVAPGETDPGMTIAMRDDVDPGMAVSVGGDFVPVMSHRSGGHPGLP